MKLIAVTQRVDVVKSYNERRDAIDQNWSFFLKKANLLPLFIPNNVEIASILLCRFQIEGILLTGGNSLEKYGGDAPERDKTEELLLKYALKMKIPLLGICRGMQVIQDFFNVSLKPVEGHIIEKQCIIYNGREIAVNSFHTFGAYTSVEDLKVLGRSYDGVIKAVKHIDSRIFGIMWHPERILPFRKEDLNLFKKVYKI